MLCENYDLTLAGASAILSLACVIFVSVYSERAMPTLPCHVINMFLFISAKGFVMATCITFELTSVHAKVFQALF